MDINDIKVEDLQKNTYQEFFPDLYFVKGLTEVNAWHNHQDIFEHILKVYKSLAEILQNPLVSQDKLAKVRVRLSKKYDSLNSQEILRLMVIYHDLGKRYTLIANNEGITQNPGYEQIAAAMVPNMAKKLSLSELEVKTLVRLVSLHGFVSDVATVYGNKKDRQLLNYFSARAKGLEVELIIFMLADLNGSDLREMNISQYQYYKKTLGTMLNFYI